MGGRPDGPRAADSANEISCILSQYYSETQFMAGACLDIAKCFDSVSLNSLGAFLQTIQAPAFLLQVLYLWENLQRHVSFGTEATGVVIAAENPRGIPQGDPLAPWCLNLVMSCWIRALQPLRTIKVFLVMTVVSCILSSTSCPIPCSPRIILIGHLVLALTLTNLLDFM